jgi:hypothetical protein
MSNPVCPYCGKTSEFIDSSEIYHGRSYGMIYICRPCQAWVGCHKDCDEPLGTLANAELRAWRKMAHARFDPLWKNKKSGGTGRMTRTGAYRWLARALGIDEENCHIGQFSLEQCHKTIDIVYQTFGEL